MKLLAQLVELEGGHLLGDTVHGLDCGRLTQSFSEGLEDGLRQCWGGLISIWMKEAAG